MMKMNFSSALERILPASLADALEIAQRLENRTRARLAIYCFVRTHLRQKGLAIASLCQLKDLTAESSPHVAENILTLATRFVDREPMQQQMRAMSLAGA